MHGDVLRGCACERLNIFVLSEGFPTCAKMSCGDVSGTLRPLTRETLFPSVHRDVLRGCVRSCGFADLEAGGYPA
jgi:hypothetical protein